MKVKGLLIVIAFFIITIFFESCCRDILPHFRRVELVIGHAETISNQSLGFGNWNLEEITIDSLATYSIELQFEKIYYAINTISLINSCYAYQCKPDGYDGPDLQVVNFVITSNNDFNENYPSGTDLTPLFFIYNSENQLTNEFVVNRMNFVGDLTTISLAERPSENLTHEFTIRIVQEDGNFFEVTTSEVLFK